MSWPPPDDFEAPPPAYEEDFDRKVALAVETSLSIQESASENDDERGTAAGGSSSTTNDRRLPPEPTKQNKQKPSWYDEAGLGQNTSTQSGSSTSQPVSTARSQLPPAPPPPFSHHPEQPPPVNQIHVIPPDPEDHDEPLPPFTAVAGVPQDQVNVMTWSASRTPSPLASPPMPPSNLHSASVLGSQINASEQTLSLPPPPPMPVPTIPARQSLPPPSRAAPQRLGPRPMTANYPPSGTPQPRDGVRITHPHVQFDPSVAYSNSSRNSMHTAPARKPAAPSSASSFYNTSVTASMAKGANLPPQASRHLPQRPPVDPRSVYDTGAYHSPKPFRAYSNMNLQTPAGAAPPQMQYSQTGYAQAGWQQPQGGYNPYHPG